MRTLSIPLSDEDSTSPKTLLTALQKKESQRLRLTGFQLLEFDDGLQNVPEYAPRDGAITLPSLELFEIPQDAGEEAALRSALQNRTALYYGEAAFKDNTAFILIVRAGTPVRGDFVQAAVTNALQEWEFFGRQTADFDGSITGAKGRQEDEDEASARVHQYWKQGTGLNFTGKDTDQPWSAAFISFIMKVSGAGARFAYSSAHRTYIFAAIAALRKPNPTYGFWGRPLEARAPEVGDLICAWRVAKGSPGPIDFAEASRGEGSYASHCDLVVEKKDGVLFAIGGNVSQSVTMKRFRLSPSGLLTPSDFPKGFALLENRMDPAEMLLARGSVKAGPVSGAPANPENHG